MGGIPDRDRAFPKPFLIESDGDGAYRLVLRVGHYNSQNYPVVTKTVVEERFATTGEARAFARDQFAANAGEFALPPRNVK